ncbi:CRISPR-associated helicase Cas3' [Pseudarthrobacter sp. AB1]|uniref:CRISPR-associated helicase Cas3' n=1 Tax=Pseudarthrobacter sp. AB1 TaxID=2138309 RepID=UPI00186B7285|nr:CRISPR-associated helicase Cas3' [Pseudarthrobacter sp. AB1]MBE4719513.1 CRISPR-associated helicase/endonuclease Cas3 [Pseudarthrobacter sp. AB1]
MLWSKRHGLDDAYPLISHLLDTAAAATALWDLWLRDGLKDRLEAALGPDARAWVAAAAGLHDVGKANPVFAGQLASGKDEPWHAGVRRDLVAAGYPLEVPAERVGLLRRHERSSALALTRTGLDFGDSAGGDWLAAAALGHHGRFQVPETPECRAFTRSAGGAWKDAREELTADVTAACGLDPDAELPPATSAVAVIIAGLVILADRTASDLDAVKQAQEDLNAGLLEVKDHAGWMVRRSAFFADRLPQTLGVYRDFVDAQTSIAGDYTLRPLQEAGLEVGDGLWIAMAPTGNGKTEAALLRHAQRPERLIFALPTQATTNAMMKRVQKAYQETGNVAGLAHRLASVEDFYAQSSEHSTADGHGLIPTEFVRNGSARMLAPVAVSTIDQVLAGSLRTKWAHLRLLTLANAHIVIDEAHLMDQYQSALAEQLMCWWGATGTRVTILSATLPQWQRDRFARAYDPVWEPPPIAFPSHNLVPGATWPLAQEGYGIAISVENTADQVSAHLKWAARMKAIAPGARLGIVSNTVGRAQDIATGLQSYGFDPIVLHSRMTAGHRRDAADRLLTVLGKGGAGTGTVVVGTQAIEASLDIDLDAMSTDLAPAPSIIQRAGRVWRHEDPRRSSRLPGVVELPLHILCSDGKSGGLPYFASELARVKRFLTGRSRLAMPDDSQAFVEASTLRLDEIDWTEQEELAEYGRRFAKAGGVVIDAAEITAPDIDFAALMRLTGHDVDEETFTRLIEGPSITVIAIDPDGTAGAPGAWTGSIQGLEAIKATDRPALRQAMEATVPLNGKLARRALTAGNPWNPRSRILEGMVPIILGQAGIGYDPLLGVIDLEAGS